MVDRIADRIVGYAGKLLIHVVRTLLVCWQRMLRLGVSVGVLGGAVAVVIGAAVTHSIPPAPLTWAAAMCFGFILGYAAAMTVLADELLLGMVETIGVLEGDIKAGLRAAAVAAEREAGEAGRGMMRFLGHKRPPTPDTHPAPVQQQQQQAPPSSPLLTLSTLEWLAPKQSQADETLAAIAATERFLNTAPRPRANARPVRADQLPRIEWASEEAEKRYARQAPTPVAIPLAEMPPLPVRTLRSPALVETTMAAAPAPTMPVDSPVRAAPAQPTAAPGASPATEPPATRDDAIAAKSDQRDDTAPMRATPPDSVPAKGVIKAGDVIEVPIEDGTAPAPAALTLEARPASDDAPSAADDEIPLATMRPPAAVSPPIETGPPERGIWARIGQALIGNTTRPLQDGELVTDHDTESRSEDERT